MSAPRIVFASDSSLLLDLVRVRVDDATVDGVHAWFRAIESARVPWIIDVHPGAASVLVEIDLALTSLDGARAWLSALRVDAHSEHGGRTVTIPVHYDGVDLAEVARHCGVPAQELARRHSSVTYRVAFLGFAPGFAYLHGLPAELACPRLATPRAHVPAGAVAIGGAHTGVYPSAGPGGWRVIGLTPLDVREAGLAIGDRVRFVAAARDGRGPTVVGGDA